MRNLFAVVIVISLFSCGKKKAVPAGILEPKKMQLVFWDYIRADIFARDFVRKDSLKRDTIENVNLQNKIFDYYKISREDFYKSYKYYADHPDLMNALMDSMITKQNKLKLHQQVKSNISIPANKRLNPLERKQVIPEKKKKDSSGKIFKRED